MLRTGLRPRSLTLHAACAFVLVLLLPGCTDPKPGHPPHHPLHHPPLTRLDIALSAPQASEPPTAPDQARDRTVQAQLDVPAGPWLAGASLQLPGLIGQARISLDGVEIATIQSGPGRASVDLPDLTAGPHRFDVIASPSRDQDPLLRGADGLRTPPLLDAPLLSLRPARHIETASAALRDNQVVARATTLGAPKGARVHFVISLDGKVITDLGTATVDQDRAQSSPTAWRGKLWRVGAPALYTLHAILEAADGTVIDAEAQTMGLREVSLGAKSFVVGGRQQPLVAVRGRPDLSPDDLVKQAIERGTNTVEFHGVPPSQAALAVLDEVGLGVALTPRCDGVLHSAMSAPVLRTRLEESRDLLARQDRQLVDSVAAHPSVLVWVVESAAEPILLDLLRAAEDQGRPIVGSSLPLTNVMLGGTEGSRPQSYSGAWVNETAWNGPRGQAELSSAAFAAALSAGARGGVIEFNDDPNRIATWRTQLAQAGVVPTSTRGLRGSSQIHLAHLPPGAVAWLQAPWLETRAAVADSQGQLLLQAWYDGPATLVASGHRTELTLRPGTWSAAGQRSPAQVLSLATPRP